jgi:micrococcal nuclease
MIIVDNYIRKATVVNVVDGDTIDLDIDLGFYTTIRQRIRLLRINTPEIFGEEKPQGLISKAYVTDKLLGKEVFFMTVKTDSFKRWLAEVWYKDETGAQININDELVEKGLAVPYMV